MEREGQIRIPAGCAIAALVSRDGSKTSGEAITNAMKPMRDRSNGLGGGFAAYGIYPEYKDFYALHLFFDSRDVRKGCEAFLKERFEIVQSEIIPTRKIPEITDEPIIWRYFVAPLQSQLKSAQLDGDEFVSRAVMKINAQMDGAYVFSSGKNMGAFKAVGFPEDVSRFYRLEEYQAYQWTAHGRYPTNTPGWWGGAHPFGLLDYTVVHNGEISSYDANRRFIEMFGYKCTLQTDVHYGLSASRSAPDAYRDGERNSGALLERDRAAFRRGRARATPVSSGRLSESAHNGPFFYRFGIQRRSYGVERPS